MPDPEAAADRLLAAGELDAARAQLDALPPASPALRRLHFALGDARAGRGEVADAFAHYASGNNLARAGFSYDPRGPERYFARIAEHLDPTGLARLGGGARARPIFIVGMPQAGTALVERVLAAHPEVQAGGALAVLPQVVGAIRKKGDDRVGFPDIMGEVGSGDLQHFAQAYLDRLPAAADGRSRLTDAQPHNFRFLGLIRAMLPEAAIVHVRRDPASTCWACYRRDLGSAATYSHDLLELARFYRAYDGLMRHWQAVLPAGAIVEVATDTLLADPEAELARLLPGCGLGWAEGCRAALASAAADAQPAADAWQRFATFLAPLRQALGPCAPPAPAAPAGTPAVTATTLQAALAATGEPALAEAQRCLKANEPAAALEIFDNRLAAGDDRWQIHWGRAASLHNLGAGEAALASLEAALHRNPASVPLCGQLGWRDPSRLDAAGQAVLEAALYQYPDDIAGAQSVAFTLGGAAHRRGGVERAFAHYQTGNSLARTELADGGDEQATWRRLQDALPPARCAELRGAGPADPAPIFIVGMPRSGTTLVEQILASHPQVQPGREREDLPSAVHSTPIEAAGAAGMPAYADRLGRSDAARMGRAYLERLPALGPGETRITDKMPDNFQLAGLIPALLPGAKIVHVTREPGDTALSIFRQPFTAGAAYRSDLAAIGRFYARYAGLMAHWRAGLPEGWLLELSYEDLVADPEGAVARLLAYCGLPWDAGCLAFHEKAPDVRTASRWQVRQPIYRSSVGQWRRYWAHLGPFFAQLGDWAPDEVRGA